MFLTLLLSTSYACVPVGYFVPVPLSSFWFGDFTLESHIFISDVSIFGTVRSDRVARDQRMAIARLVLDYYHKQLYLFLLLHDLPFYSPVYTNTNYSDFLNIMIKTTTILSILYIQLLAMAGSFAFATPLRRQLAQRAAPDNTVVINGPQSYWYVSFPHIRSTTAALKKAFCF